MSTVEFVIENTDHTTVDFSLEPGQSKTFGRSSNKSEIKVNDDLCSGLHCRISYVRNTIFIEDLESKNGVFVNNIRINKQRFYKDDRIRLGHTYIYLHPNHNSSHVLNMLTRQEEQRDPLTGKVARTDDVPYLKLERKRKSLTKTDIVGRQAAKELPGHLEEGRKQLTEKQIDRLIMFSNFLDYFSTIFIFLVTIGLVFVFIPEFKDFAKADIDHIEFTNEVYISFAVILFIPMIFHKINKSLKSGSIGERLSGYNKHFNY